MSKIKVGDVVEWTVGRRTLSGSCHEKRIKGVVEWVDKGSMATPEPMAVVLVRSVFAYAEGHEDMGRSLPVARDYRLAESTEIMQVVE